MPTDTCQSRLKDIFALSASELQLGLEEVTCPLPSMTLPFVRPPADCQLAKPMSEALIQLSVKLTTVQWAWRIMFQGELQQCLMVPRVDDKSAFGQVKRWDHPKSLTALAYIKPKGSSTLGTLTEGTWGPNLVHLALKWYACAWEKTSCLTTCVGCLSSSPFFWPDHCISLGIVILHSWFAKGLLVWQLI